MPGTSARDAERRRGRAGSASSTPAERDPVCGLVLDPEAALPAFEQGGLRHVFCSNDCRRRFLTRGLEPV